MSLNTILATAPNTTTNYVLKATGSALGNSLIYDNGTNVSINTTTNGSARLYVLAGTSSHGIRTLATSSTYWGGVFAHTSGYETDLANDTCAASFYGPNGISLNIQDISAAISGQTTGYIGMSTSAFSGNNGDLVLYPRTSVASRILLMGGNVGIGTTTPDNLLVVSGGTGSMKLEATTTNRSAFQIFNNTNSLYVGVDNASASYFGYTAYSANIQTLNYPIIFSNGSGAPTERIRITNTGNTYFGNASGNGLGGMVQIDALNGLGSGNDGLGIKTGGATNAIPLLLINTYTAGDIEIIRFYSGANNNRGNIVYSTANGQLRFSGYAAGTYSDARLKDIKGDCSYGLDTISKIKVYDFNWLRNGNKGFGVKAQELYDLIPEVVEVGNDAEIDPQEYDYRDIWKVNYNELVPVLIKAIQEMNTKINQQQQTINSLINR